MSKSPREEIDFRKKWSTKSNLPIKNLDNKIRYSIRFVNVKVIYDL